MTKIHYPLALVLSLAARCAVEGFAVFWEETCTTFSSGNDICAQGEYYSPSLALDGNETVYEGPYEAIFQYTGPGTIKDVKVSVKWPDGDESSDCTVSVNGKQCNSCKECEAPEFVGEILQGKVKYDCTNIKNGKNSVSTCESIDYSNKIFFPLKDKAFDEGTDDNKNDQDDKDDNKDDDTDDTDPGDDEATDAPGRGNAARTPNECMAVVKDKCNCRSNKKKNRDCSLRIVNRFCKKLPKNSDRKAVRVKFVAKCNTKKLRIRNKKRSN